MKKIDIVLGLQWGDEGKGKITDFLAPTYGVVARGNGGPNAGHMIKVPVNKSLDELFPLHTVPSGIFGSGLNHIGAGVVTCVSSLRLEIEGGNDKKGVSYFQPNWKNQLNIAGESVLILPIHKALDGIFDKMLGIGTTKKGIGPAYADLCYRNAILVRDIKKPGFKKKVENVTDFYKKNFWIAETIDNSKFFEDARWLVDSLEVVSSSIYINDMLEKGHSVLAEGAQGTFLDNRFGTYPFVTSSSCISGGVLTGLGVGPGSIGNVYGIFKAYCTRVGNGPMPGELNNDVGDKIAEIGREFGSTTGRPRRPAWLDLVALKYACRINGVTHPIMTKGDVFDDPFFETISVTDNYILPNGSKTNQFISDAELLGKVKPEYTEFKAWDDLGKTTIAHSVHPYLRNYLSHIETAINLKVSMISNGPGREQIISL